MKLYRLAPSALLIALLLNACGGGEATAPPPPANNPPPATGIGAAGGTVTGPAGSKVMIPAGALTTNIEIGVAQTSVGAPALPAGITAAGLIYAFTPHGTNFATPATITVPFDPTLAPVGAVFLLYKTNAALTAWIAVPGATVSGSTMSGAVSGFSYAVVAPQPPEGFPELTEKEWKIDAYDFGGSYVNTVLENTKQTGGLVDRIFAVGEDLLIFPDNQPIPPKAQLVVYSNASGKTFYTIAQAPHAPPSDPNPLNTADVELTQTYTFKVRDPGASLKYVVSSVLLELVDDGGSAAGLASCPWIDPTLSEAEIAAVCADALMFAFNDVSIKAHAVLAPDDFFSNSGFFALGGSKDHWFFLADPPESQLLFSENDFFFDRSSVFPTPGAHVSVTLNAPKTIAIPLSSLSVGDIFNVTVSIRSYARNVTQGESYAVAYFRDPVDFVKAASIEFTGLEQLPVNHDPVPPLVPAACASPDATAGQFEFEAATYSSPENPLAVRTGIRRVNGTHGEVRVKLNTVDGTALAGGDYTAQQVVIRFGDGEGGSKYVNIPLTVDEIAEADETAQLTLTPFSGCATLGGQSTAILEILDDDRPIAAPATYTIGGTITGLAGSGLVLKNVSTGLPANVSGNSFTMPDALTTGTSYNIVVDTQPVSPQQSCTVSNGVGTVSGANVTNLVVTCVTPAPSGSLDSTFGDNGRVLSGVEYFSPIFNARISMALQADGKILMVGGLKLLRFNSNGTPDTSFGTSGVVSVVLNGGAVDAAMDVAVQSDGKIVVAGTAATRTVGSDDFALVRYNPNGTVDTAFGNNGHVQTDFFASTDRLERMRLQDDGKIIVIGSATQVVSSTTISVTFGVARYNADGSPDTTFSSTGKISASPFGAYSIARGIAIQGDGKFVVAGSTANDGVNDPDTGFIRFLGGGSPVLDATFGFAANGTVHAPLGGYDEAVDVVILDDGSILSAIKVDVGVTTGGRAFGFGKATLPANGIPPPLSAGGITFSTESDVPRRMLKQADGKIVMVGQSAALGANPNMAIVRYGPFGLDTTFDSDGKLTVDFFGSRESAEDVVQQADGKLVMGGYARSGSTNYFALVRLAQ